MATPSIKGTAVQGLVEDMLELLDGGRLERDALEARLEPRALALLDAKVSPASWIPLPVYDQLAKVLLEADGGSAEDYMRRRGEKTGRRLLEAGLYQQLDFVKRRDRATSVAQFARDLRLILSLQAALVNVGDWKVEADPDDEDRLMIVVHGAEPIPDLLAFAMAGFFTGVSQASRSNGLVWTLERRSRGTLRIRMDRGLGDLVD